MTEELLASCPECGQDVPATVGDRAVPDTEAVREALAELDRATVCSCDVLPDEDGHWMGCSADLRRVVDVVRAALARDVPTGRDLTTDDVPDIEAEQAAVRAYRRYPEKIAELNHDAATIVRAALARDNENERLARMAMQMRDRMHDDDPIGDRDRAELAEDLERIRAALARDVPAPEPQADEPPFAVGDRVRVKSTGRTGVLREIDSRGRHLIFGDDESWITGVRADNLEPAPEPPRFERGFYRLARYLRLGSGATTQGRIIVHGPVGDDGDLWVSVAYSDDAGQVSAAALAAAGAVREEGQA